MDKDKLLDVLKDFGLTCTEAEIYLFLAKHEALKGTEIAKLTKKDKAQIYHILKSLQTKGIVESTLQTPVRFTPVPFEKIVELTIKSKRDEAAKIENTKEDLLKYWSSISKNKIDLTTEKFVVIDGRQKVYSKIANMVAETKNQLSAITTVAGLFHADQFGVFDSITKNGSKSNIEFRFLTEISKLNSDALKSILENLPMRGLNFNGRSPNAGLKLSPQLVIRDNEELLFFMTPRLDPNALQDNVCLWTNCTSLVQAFTIMFEDLWSKSIEIEKKIVEVETGKPTPSSIIFDSKKSAHAKFEELVTSAKKDIIFLTSADGLQELSENILLEALTKKGVSIIILSPIVRINFEAAKRLSRFCSVRHVNTNYCEIIIVDGKQLLQINSELIGQAENATFVNAVYSYDQEYINIITIALNDIWNKAASLSNVGVESTELPVGPPIFPLPPNNLLSKLNGIVVDFKPPGTLSEQEIVSKIINAKKLVTVNPAREPSRMYASVATAMIHPPDYFRLPELLIFAFHVDKHSSFGAEDYLVIHQRIDESHLFTPVVIAGDNPNARPILMEFYKNTPAGENHLLFNKDEVEIRVHGNTLSAAWSVPIPLYPKSLTLPPACIQIEGYGNVKTMGYSSIFPSGFRNEVEENYFDSFVTFFHPASKYSGPGTDAVFCRDFIVTNYPPKGS